MPIMNAQIAPGYAVVDAAIAAQRCVLLDGGIATELPHQSGQDHERTLGDGGSCLGSERGAGRPSPIRRCRGRRDHDQHVGASRPARGASRAGDPSDSRRCTGWRSPAAVCGLLATRSRTLAARGRWRWRSRSTATSMAARAQKRSRCWRGRSRADPPELFLLETLSVLTPSLFDVVSALLETGIPVWLSFRRCRHGLCGVYGQHWGGPEGDAFGRAARRFEEMGVARTAGQLHPARPCRRHGLLPARLHRHCARRVPEPRLLHERRLADRDRDRRRGVRGDGVRWRAEGAQIIGGCCGTRPEHIAAAREALAGTRPGHERHEERAANGAGPASAAEPLAAWSDRRGRALHPLEFPSLRPAPRASSAPIPGSYLTWRYLFEHNIGAQQRCLDIGSGVGLQTVQLALNGAAHVHAIDLDERAATNTLENAFRQGVAERVSAEVADIYPWLPEERYEVVVANVPQTPVDPRSQLSSHRPTDYWGRGLVDQIIGKLRRALAPEGRAFLTLASLLSREKTLQLLAVAGYPRRSLPGSCRTCLRPPGLRASTSLTSSSSRTATPCASAKTPCSSCTCSRSATVWELRAPQRRHGTEDREHARAAHPLA